MRCFSVSQFRHPELVSGSIGRSVMNSRGKAQTDRQIMPIGIFALDKIDFPISSPVLDLLFSSDSIFHRVKLLISNKLINLIALGKTFDGALAMLRQSGQQIARDANIERAKRFACKDVDAGLSLIGHGAVIGEKWLLKQVQHDGMAKA